RRRARDRHRWRPVSRRRGRPRVRAAGRRGHARRDDADSGRPARGARRQHRARPAVVTSPGRARLLGPAMLGVASGAVLVPLNSTMLAVALPSIMDDFGIDAATVSTLVTLYLGTVTIALLASGSLGDRYGQRRVFLVGVVAFAVSSLIAALAPSFAVLTLARVLQALSGALISTTSVALVRALAPLDRRGTAFGLFDMLVSISAAIAPFVGGVLVGAFGWQSLFLLAVPFAVFAVVTVGFLAPPTATTEVGKGVP